MSIQLRRAESDADREAVYRFRYGVYVKEMGRYRRIADHDGGRLVEPEDAHSVNYLATDGTDAVGVFRMTFGADGLSQRQIRQYSLQPFLAELPAQTMAIGERLMVTPALRGSGLVAELMGMSQDDVADRGVRLVFGDCEPHLLPLYVSMGSRPYAEHNINSEEAGYLIPLLTVAGDAQDLVGLGGACTPDGRPAVPACLQHALAESGSVLMSALAPADTYWAAVHGALEQVAEQKVHAFAGLDDDETRRCLERSTIIECAVGDRVLKQGGSSHNLFVVLDGLLEVRDGTRPVNVLVAGDVFGEMAFLLGVPRQRDVYAVAPSTRVLSLSEGGLRRIIADDPAAGAKLLLNIAKMLCRRLIDAR